MSTLFLRKGWLLAVLLLPLTLAAQNLPERPNPPRLVNDLARVLSPDEAALLERKLVAFSDSTSNQVAIVTIPTTDGYDMNDYATKLYNKWGIGTAKNNNGVLLVSAMQDHKVYISVGRGLQAALPDILASHIVEDQIKPSFRENNYYRGFNNAVTAIIAATRGEYKGDGRAGQSEGFSAGQLIALIVIIIIIFSFIRRGGGGGGSFMSRRGYGGFGGGFFSGSILGSSLGSGGGWGGGGDSGGGGGFGGFGGGSTDGGGAGGSW